MVRQSRFPFYPLLFAHSCASIFLDSLPLSECTLFSVTFHVCLPALVLFYPCYLFNTLASTHFEKRYTQTGMKFTTISFFLFSILNHIPIVRYLSFILPYSLCFLFNPLLFANFSFFDIPFSVLGIPCHSYLFFRRKFIVSTVQFPKFLRHSSIIFYLASFVSTLISFASIFIITSLSNDMVRLPYSSSLLCIQY